jgi:hypothetical protein
MLEKVKDNKDVVYNKTVSNCEIYYQEHLCNVLEFMKDFYPRLSDNKNDKPSELFPGICKEIEADESMIIQFIFSGLMILNRDGIFYSIDLSKAPSRPTSDSIAEPDNVMGSRDGFVENIKENISLIRTRVKDDRLNIDVVNVGKRSKTVINLLSLSDIHNEDIKRNILDKLNSIDIDAIISIEDLMAYFQKDNIFPSYHYIGNPDTAVRRLYDGEFMIVIDRICVVVMLPTTLAYTSRLKIDGINIPYFVGIERFFILVAAIVSIFMCGIFCSFVTVQKDSLSLMVLSTLKVTQTGVYLPIFIEILIILGLFELYYLIGFRQARFTVSSTIVLIGGLIIGQNLISSGVAGVFIMTITAICYLMSFIVSSNVNTIVAISMCRLLMLVASLIYGLFGVIIAAIVLGCYLYKQKTFGIPYFYPFAPFDEVGVKNFFVPSSSLKNKKRSKLLNVKNVFRRNKND